MGVKISGASHKMLETRFPPSTSCWGVWRLILTPMADPRAGPLVRAGRPRSAPFLSFVDADDIAREVAVILIPDAWRGSKAPR